MKRSGTYYEPSDCNFGGCWVAKAEKERGVWIGVVAEIIKKNELFTAC